VLAIPPNQLKDHRMRGQTDDMVYAHDRFPADGGESFRRGGADGERPRHTRSAGVGYHVEVVQLYLCFFQSLSDRSWLHTICQITLILDESDLAGETEMRGRGRRRRRRRKWEKENHSLHSPYAPSSPRSAVSRHISRSANAA